MRTVDYYQDFLIIPVLCISDQGTLGTKKVLITGHRYLIFLNIPILVVVKVAT